MGWGEARSEEVRGHELISVSPVATEGCNEACSVGHHLGSD